MAWDCLLTVVLASQGIETINRRQKSILPGNESAILETVRPGIEKPFLEVVEDSMLQIRLLGQFDVRLDGKRVLLPSRAAQSMLAYFAMTAGIAHRREKLAGTFWPELSEESARKNLRQELWRIRKAVSTGQTGGNDYLQADDLTITFNRQADYWLDVSHFEQPALDVEPLLSSLALYQGELLPGFYEEWVLLERERLRSLFDNKMEQSLALLVAAERWTTAQEQAERWLALGSSLEPAYRALMLVHGARGDMARVSSIYQQCIIALEEEVGLEPSSETRALYDGLLKGAQVSSRALKVQTSGTVTFLFTDIEGSTNLLDQLGEQYALALADHHEILRSVIRKWNGQEVDTQGDAFFVTFVRAMDAIQCTAEAQRLLASHPWPQGQPLWVRMGLHTGEPLIASTGYIGMDVHRAARIGDAAHGGQVLLSQTTRDLVLHDLPKELGIRDLGEHRLKDMKYPTPIYQLVVEGLRQDFPPLRTRFSGTEAPLPGVPPFKGLQYFEEADAELFFGRELLTAKLVDRLRQTRFLSVIIGASGSGKSSLVRAGLIPALKKEKLLPGGARTPEGRERWQVYVTTPTARPLEALAIELTRGSESITAAATLMDDMLQDPRSLYLHLTRLHPRDHALLVLDQFEELFTLCRDEFMREAFIDNLLTALQQGGDCLTLVITLRADFYAHLAQYPELREAVAQQQEYIGPMTMDELRRAIEEPARRAHWAFEPGLVDLILRDIGDEPGALPLLSHALLETWKRRAGHTLTLKGYADAGGVRGAIAHTAETLYQSLSTEEQAIARDIFLRLTELGEGTEDTRRRASFAELVSHTERPDDVRAVLNALADARLVTLGEDTAEVAHEALIREWPALRDWLNQDRESLKLHRHLTEAAHEWELLERDAGLLYRGARLAQAREWAALHPNALNTMERAFLEASIEQNQREIREKEEQQAKELAQARKLAETEKARAEEQTHSANRLRLRNRIITGVGMVALVLAVAAVLFGQQSNTNAAMAQANLETANQQRATAEASFQQAESRRLGAEGVALVQNPGGDPELAALLAIRGLQMVYSPQADAALQLALPRLYARRVLQPPARSGPLYSIAISPDGKALLTSDLVLHDAETGMVSMNLRTKYDPEAWGTHVSLSPDGKRALAGIYWGHTAEMWDVKTGRELQIFTGHGDRVMEGVFSPDGKWVVTVSADKTARLWDAATGKQVRVFSGHTDQVQSVAFSPDGKQLLTGSSDQTARLWDTATGQTVRIFKVEDSSFLTEIFSVSFSPDGRWILASGGAGIVWLWDAGTGELLRQFKGHAGPVRSAVFSPDGRQVLTSGDDMTARLWDARTGEMLRIFAGHTDSVGKAIFAPDGRSVYTASWDDTIRQWNLESDERLFPLPVITSGGRFALGKDPIFFIGYEDKIAWLRAARTGRELAHFSGHTDRLSSFDISRDRKVVLTGSYDGTVRIWDALTGSELRVLRGHTDLVNAVFSADGKYILTASRDKTIRVWQAATGRELRVFSFSAATNWPNAVAISPDDDSVLIDVQDDPYFGMWDIGKDRLVHQWPKGDGAVITSLSFSPDGRFILSSDNNGKAQVWKVGSSGPLHTFNHPGMVYIATYSPDGTSIWTGCTDGKVRQWDAATGQLVRVFDGPRGVSWIDDISADGKQVLVEYADQTVHLFDTDYHDTIRYACSRLVRDLTTDERNAYGISGAEPTCPKS
jgi:WD40 repeat protein/DNA-binding SARP family transcriptional activator